MITPVVQRWRDRRGSYRPSGETIRTSDYEVAPIRDDRTAKAFVTAHHYSGSYPAARFRFGLYRGGNLVGVAVFSVPANPRTLDLFPSAEQSVELGRFVLTDDVPGDGETFFLARCFEALRREEILGIISFSDPMPRTSIDGSVTFAGHIGTIYQAHNAVYLGRSRAETRRMLPDGSILHNRALAKIRARDQGCRYSAALLEAHGAEPLGDGDPEAWLARWLPVLTRPVKHPRNHRYAWMLGRRVAQLVPSGLPYPKFSRAD